MTAKQKGIDKKHSQYFKHFVNKINFETYKNILWISNKVTSRVKINLFLLPIFAPSSHWESRVNDERPIGNKNTTIEWDDGGK